MKNVKIARINMVYVGKAWIKCTNGNLSDSCPCGCFEGVAAWKYKAYFVYFFLDEMVFISPVNEMCGERVETFVKEIICRANSS